MSGRDKKRDKLVILRWTAEGADLNDKSALRSFHTNSDPASEQRISYYNRVRRQSPLSRISIEAEHLSKAA
jgi:hypothetical protein